MELYHIDLRLQHIERLLLGTKTVLTFNEVVDYTGLSSSYLYKLTSAGMIPHSKPNGKQLFFDKAEIDAWLLRNPAKSSAMIEAEAVNYVTLK